MTQVEIENVGPIHHLKFELPDEGGVVVLEGPNGAGKTTTIQTLAGEYDTLTPRDGTIAGHVKLGTLELTVGQRVTERGALEVRRLIPGADPSVLVDPGFKSPESNDLRRVLALCALAGLEPKLDLFEQALGKPAGVELRALVGTEALTAKTIPEQAKLVKAALEKASRTREDEAAGLRHRAGGLAAAMEGVSDAEPSDADVLALATEEAVRAKADLDARYRSASDALQLQANAKHRLEQLGADAAGVAGAQDRLDTLRKGAELAMNARVAAEDALVARGKEAALQERGAEDEVRRIEATLVEARARYAEHQEKRIALDKAVTENRIDGVTDQRKLAAQIQDAERGLAAAAASQVALADLRRIVEAPLPAAPEQAEVASAELRLSAARKAQERGAVVREARARQAQAVALLQQADEQLLAGTALRDASQGVWQVVEDAVERVKPRGLRLIGGRVVFQHPVRGDVYFEELSQGERWRVALDAAVDAVGEGGLVGIRQEAWEGLDPANRAAIAAHARERRAVVVTAQASDGALRATVVR